MPVKPFVVGVDVGTQSAKVMVFDSQGELICSGSHPLRALDIPAPSLAEHPDDDIWTALLQAFELCSNKFRALALDTRDISAIGLCVIRCCRAMLRADGQLAWPVINWMDKRLNKPYQHQPEFGDVAWVTTSSGYITHRLTGRFVDTCANYIGWWPVDDQTRDWSTDQELWQQCGLSRDQVFELVDPGEVLGPLSAEVARTLGLSPGVPVVATAHDKAVEALGAGALHTGTLLISLGTYIGAIVHGDSYQEANANYWTFQASLPGQYLHECMGVRRGMWTVSWFRDQFGAAALAAIGDDATAGDCSMEELLNREAEAVPAGSDGLITIHDWAAPPEAEFRKGAIIGFDGRHTRAHMYRSLLEGIAFRLKTSVDAMADETGTPIDSIVVSGGGANSDVLMQILADMFGVPARRNTVTGSAAVGCAINAGLAAGVYATVDEATELLVKVAKQFQPIAAHHELYARVHQSVYLKCADAIDPVLQQSSRLFD